MSTQAMKWFSIFLLMSFNVWGQDEELRSPTAVPPMSASPSGAEKVMTLPPGVVEKVYEGTTDLTNMTQARRKIVEEAITNVSEEAVQNILGPDRYKKNRKVIVEKVFKQSGRYIPVLKTGVFTPATGGQKLSVTLHINSKVLEAILLEQGLLYDNEGAPMMVPFVSVEDQIKGEAYRWWKNKNPMGSQPLAEYLEDQLQKALFDLGFYVQRPIASQMNLLLPTTYQQELLTPEQILALASRWGIPLALAGGITIRRDGNGDVMMELQATVFQVSTGRILAQLIRQQKWSKSENFEKMSFKKNYAFAVQAFRDLGQQMLEAWQRGVLTSTLVRLEVQGGLPINKYDLFKDSLKSANRSIRQVRERVISADSVLFELEINGGISELSAKLNQVVVGDQTYKLKGLESNNTIVMGLMK